MKRVTASPMASVALAALALCPASCTLIEDGWRPVRPRPAPIAGIPVYAGPGRGPAEPAQAEPAPPPAAPDRPVEATIEQAVLLALENNRALRVERLNPHIQRTFVEQELAAFEPVLSAEASAARERLEGRTGSHSRDSTTGGGVAVSQFLPTGATVDVGVTTERTWGNSKPQQHATRAGLSVTQALLQGRDVAANLANLRQARLDSLLSEYEFRGFAEALVAGVEAIYWEYVLARRQAEIVQESLKLAQQQLDDTRHRVRAGDLAETELAAAEAEVALRREALINTGSRVTALQVRLLRLMYPQMLGSVQREVTPQTQPVVPPIPLELLQDHMAVALRMRPDLNQAEILVQRGDLEIVKTRNGLLPRMDLFISLGKTGYADSFAGSVGDIAGDGYDVSVGLAFAYPLTNRDARARHQRALLTREQAQESLGNLRDLVRQDVELAFIEVHRTRQQVDATASTRRLQEEKLRAETAKFRVGKSTALLVAAAQRDLLASQVAEVESVTNHLRARTSLYLLEGSLLARRGLAAPGRGQAAVRPGAVTSRPTTAPATRPVDDGGKGPPG